MADDSKERMADDSKERMTDTKKTISQKEIAKSRLFRSRKLAIWDTRTFKPIFNHDDLESIMATLGFVAVPSFPAILPPTGTGEVFVSETTWKQSMNPATATSSAAGKSAAAAPVTTWKEYIYSAAGRFQTKANSPPLPLPRLPYPRIDGLHVASYKAFLNAVNFYLRKGSDLSNIFHIRGMPLNPADDQDKVWILMDEDDLTSTVYRDGTLDDEAYDSHDARLKYDLDKLNKTSDDCKMVPLKDIIPDFTETACCHGTLDQEVYNSNSARNNDEDRSNLDPLNDIIHDIAEEHDSPSP